MHHVPVKVSLHAPCTFIIDIHDVLLEHCCYKLVLMFPMMQIFTTYDSCCYKSVCTVHVTGSPLSSWYKYSCVATRTMGRKRILGLGKEIMVFVTMEIKIFTASLFLQEHTHLVQTPGLIGNRILITISFQYKYSFVVTRTMGWKGSIEWGSVGKGILGPCDHGDTNIHKPACCYKSICMDHVPIG